MLESSILVWNYRGYGDISTVAELKNPIKQLKPHIVFLLETKRSSKELDRIWWNLGLRWRLTGFYGQPETGHCNESWALLKSLMHISYLSWLCIGDFNEILSESEKQGGNPRPRRQTAAFASAIEYCAFEEGQFQGGNLIGCCRAFVIKVVAGILAIGIGGLIILTFYFIKKFSTRNEIFYGLMKKDDCENIEAFLRDKMHLAPKRYSFEDVTKLTNNFRDKLGEGGFGSVYKMKLSDGSQVVVKVLNKAKDNGEAFINEVASISRTSHVNVVTLLGFYFKGHVRVLFYEFVLNGSLEQLIHEESALKADHLLKWETLNLEEERAPKILLDGTGTVTVLSKSNSNPPPS